MKKQSIIKFFSMILGLYLTVSVTAAIQINAEEKQNTETQKTETDGLLAETNAEVIDSGTCGENLTWKLTDDGTLTISGTGYMPNYNGDSNIYNSASNGAPWFMQRAKITSVKIEDGVKNIGDFAFYDCTSLTSITIPNSVTNIGSNAFGHCTNLLTINCGFAEGAVSGAPWGAENAVINYNVTE